MIPIAINISVLDQKFIIHRFDADSEIPLESLRGENIFHISKTHEELSIVCGQEVSLNSNKSSELYICMKVLGPLDFSLVGILGRITGVLMKRDIPVFVVSTFDTDYILINDDNADSAIKVLNEDEYISITINYT